MNILETIIKNKRLEIDGLKSKNPKESLALPSKTPRDFISAIKNKSFGLIAEVKRKSPSAGIIRQPFDPIDIAKSYADNGASAISCLIDKKYFGGGADDFTAIYNVVTLPMLYKEFVIDVWQIDHAYSIGASAVLLIAAILSDDELLFFSSKIKSYGMTPLIEVHSESELLRIQNMETCCIGINNRNLKTFETSLETTRRLIHMVPPHITVISESGIKNEEDIQTLKTLGVNAALVGEHLLKEKFPGKGIKKMLSKVV